MQIITKKLNEIRPYEKNPRKNDEAVKYVAKSIQEFGFKVPIVIDKDGVIVCGHTRYKAATKLKMEEVPCIMADDLSDDQIKAFRLADNKVAEKAEWDFELLNVEIAELINFDFSDFGFDDIDLESDEPPIEWGDETQKRVANILNLEKGQYTGAGPYDIPIISPVSIEEVGEITEWIPFNYVLSEKNPEGKGVHFFIDDYQFMRIWNQPECYIDRLKQFKAVLTPDFSPYGDMPMAAQIFNHYRKHWVGVYLQRNGVTVIPTIRASTDERSLEWYLDGEPSGGVVAISSMWTSDKESMDYFMNEYNTMFETLKPTKVFVYGEKVPNIQGNIERIRTTSEMRFNRGD